MLAGRIGLAIGDDDLDDVTVRLNAILEHLAALDTLDSEPTAASLAAPR